MQQYDKAKHKANVISTSTDCDFNDEHAYMVASAARHTSNGGSERNVWYLDTGALQHFTCNCDFLEGFVLVNSTNIQLGDNRAVLIEGYGTITATITINGCDSELRLLDVVLTLSLAKNLISPSRLVEQGHLLSLDINGARVTVGQDGPVMLTARHSHGMLISPLCVQQHAEHVASTSMTISLRSLHCHLGHVGKDRLLQMAHTTIDLCDLHVINNLDDCVSCIKGKLGRTPIG